MSGLRGLGCPPSRAIAASLIVAGLVACNRGVGEPRAHVFGEARMNVHYDAARIVFSGEYRGETPAAAVAGAVRVRDAITATLARWGVSEADREAGVASQAPVHFGAAGYWMSGASADVRIRDLEQAPRILKAVRDAIRRESAIAKGSRIDLMVDDRSFLATARDSAISDARARAAQLAGLAGLRLGKTISIEPVSLVAPMAAWSHGGHLNDPDVDRLPSFIAREQDRVRTFGRLLATFEARSA